MSPLWESSTVKKLKINKRKPSPKHSRDYQSFAQSVIFCRHRQFPQFKLYCNTIKGISLFTSLRQQLNASMTVEAAVVLPLFLFFFLNLGCVIELIRLHGNLEFALCDVGNRMAVYGYALTEIGDKESEKAKESGLWSEIKDVAFSYAYVKSEIVNYVGEQYLEEAPIEDGVNGLQFLESEIFAEDDCFEIIVTYKAAPFSSVIGFRPFRMVNRYYGHIWNGYQIPGTEDNRENPDVVYVAANGVVYHEDKECSHLSLSIRKVSLQTAYESRNINGERYVPCMRCEDTGLQGSVYITDDGDNIHYGENCAGLKRTVQALPRVNAKAYRACSRCARK